jgi:Protein of unknown function (DUF1553)/Protein of unknown function (DUF1549)/Planctomycete cytochrome C
MPRIPLLIFICSLTVFSIANGADKKADVKKLVVQKKSAPKKEAKKPAVKKPVTENKVKTDKVIKDKKANASEIFDKKIKPILVKYCYECHSKNGKSIEGGLELDSPSGMLRGGDSGPMLLAHHVDKSAVIKMLEHDDDVSAMPPENKLPAAAIQAFKEWIRLGAPDSRKDVGPTEKEKRMKEAKNHWSFQPLKTVGPPSVKQTGWARNPAIDNPILAQLEAKGLNPVSDANKRTLVRRVYFDLVGIPPTPKEVNSFLADQSPEALSKLIDKLLASPQFGQRWGRHWLDVVRFAESSGMEFNFTYPHAWPFRNYVIDSMNQDKPFNLFLREQISGDLIPAKKGDSPEVIESRKIASSVLSFGPKRHNSGGTEFRMNIVDDQINTITRSMLALTVSCARCHDHKFDPVPTKDYYALAGIFLSTEPLYGTIKQKYSNNPTDLLPIGPNAQALHAAAEAHDKKIKEAEKTLATKKGELKKADEVVKQADKKKTEAEKALAALKTKPKTKVTSKDKPNLQTKQKPLAVKTVVAKKEVIQKETTPKETTDDKKPELKKEKPASKKTPAKKPVVKKVSKKTASKKAEPKKAVPKKDGPKKTGPKKAELKKETPAKTEKKKEPEKKVESPEVIAKTKLDEAIKQLKDSKTKSEKLKSEIAPLEKKVAEVKKKMPPRPKYAMTARDRAKPADTKVAIRGNFRELGEAAPRGYLTAVNVPNAPGINPKQSGRVELAQWVTNPGNPLTARVMVNRIWHHLFGRGIVTTTDNFGLIGKKPTHPELLDTLSLQFMNEGWSVKKMIKTIMLSRAYQLSSEPNTDNLKIDPNNILFWRATPRRIEAEIIRDSILAISGQINLSQLESSTVTPLGDQLSRGIAPEKIQPPSNHRSVYLPIVRDYIPEIFDLFDFPSPSLVTGSRSVTNVPTQALFMRNSKFISEQARHAAKRLLASKEASDDIERVHLAMQWAFSRHATSEEEAGAMELIQHIKKAKPKDPAQTEKAWAALFHTLFATAEFRYLVDIK